MVVVVWRRRRRLSWKHASMPVDSSATNKVSLMPVSSQQSNDTVELRRLHFHTPGLSLSVCLSALAACPPRCPSHPLDTIRVMVIVWRLRGNIIRTALYWIVWHNVHSQQHTYVSSSYRSNRLGLSHWDPYAVRRGGCLELYYCNMVEWFWWDSSLIFDDQLVSFSALTLLVWSSGL